MRRGLRSAAAVGMAALLWAGLSPGTGTALGAHAAGRAPDPGAAVAWGNDDAGRLGRGVGSGVSTTPVTVCGGASCADSLDDVVAVEAGSGHGVALRDDGTVWTWGYNQYGQLGDGTTTARTTPAQVPALTDVTAIAAGDNHTLALKRDGTVFAWGRNNAGQLGDGTTTDRSSPVQVACLFFPEAGCADPVLANVTAIAAGAEHSLSLHVGGDVGAWGSNTYGQLGNGTNDPSLFPHIAAGLPAAVKVIAAGSDHSVAVRQDGGAVYGWGRNGNGQLGDGTTNDTNWPVQVCAVGTSSGCTTFLTGVNGVEAGGFHTLAVVTDGGVRSWGYNGSGQLGDGTTQQRLTPVRVCGSGTTAGCTVFLGGVNQVSAGAFFSLTRQTDGTARAWGMNTFGQLGDGTQTTRLTPVRVCAPGQTASCGRLLEGAGTVAAGSDFSLAIARPRADVRIAISAQPEPVASFDELTYTITVRNDGPTAADDVTVDSTPPVQGAFVSATPSRGSCVGPLEGTSGPVTCSLGRVGANVQATVTIKVSPVAEAGTMLTHTVSVSSSTPDPKQVNNTATLRTPVS